MNIPTALYPLTPDDAIVVLSSMNCLYLVHFAKSSYTQEQRMNETSKSLSIVLALSLVVAPFVSVQAWTLSYS